MYSAEFDICTLFAIQFVKEMLSKQDALFTQLSLPPFWRLLIPLQMCHLRYVKNIVPLTF